MIEGDVEIKKILLVDDSQFMRQTLKNILLKENTFSVEEANNGFEAVQKYKSLCPDLVILDFVIPPVDGLTILKEIISYDPKAKIIMCSSLGQESVIMECLQYGAKDFIIKPYLNNLNTVIKKLI